MAWRLGLVRTSVQGVLPGVMSGFVAENVAVDERQKCCQAILSVLGAAGMTAVDAVAILDSGSCITSMSVGIANKLQAAFPDVKVVGGMSQPGKLKVADGRVLKVETKHARCRSRCTPAGAWSPWIRFYSPSCRGMSMLSLLAIQR